MSIKHYLVQHDKNLLKWFYQRPFRPSLALNILIFMGDGPFWMLLVLASALAGQLLGNPLYSELAVLLILGLSIGNMTFTPLKKNIKRKRPYADRALQQDLRMEIQNRDHRHASKEYESFPSGHVQWTTLCVIIISFEFGWAALLLLGWMVPAMMILRPYLGVHYPSDVLAGLVLGCLNAGVALFAGTYLIDLIDQLKHYPYYYLGYWAVITAFLIFGFKSWTKRV